MDDATQQCVRSDWFKEHSVGGSAVYVQGRYKILGRDHVKGAGPADSLTAAEVIMRSGWSARNKTWPTMCDEEEAARLQARPRPPRRHPDPASPLDPRTTAPSSPCHIGCHHPGRHRGPHPLPHPATQDQSQEFMLFDVETDPGETTDLSLQHPEIVARMAERMDELAGAAEKFRDPKSGKLALKAAGNYKRWSGKSWIKLCRGCANVGLQSAANYQDEEGSNKKLCSPCARKAGTWKLQNHPCRDPTDAKRDANYEDEEEEEKREGKDEDEDEQESDKNGKTKIDDQFEIGRAAHREKMRKEAKENATKAAPPQQLLVN